MHVAFSLLRVQTHCDQGPHCNQGSVASPSSPLSPARDGLPCGNLYLDSKRILCACAPPALWGPQQELEEDELCLEITLILDRLVHCVRPQQLLFIAVGGAPHTEGEGGEQQAAQEAASLATGPGGAGEASELAFMRRLTTHLRAFMPRKLATDPAWGDIPSVILSDSSVPGTGEQKIARFMERQQQPPLFRRHPPKQHSFANHGSSLVFLGLLQPQSPRCFMPQEDAHMAEERQRCTKDEMVILQSPNEDISNAGSSLIQRFELSSCSVPTPSLALAPGRLQWSPRLHSFFPPPFQRAVRELLLINECRGFAAGIGGQSSEAAQLQQQAQQAVPSIRLPEEVLMLVLVQLARPLLAWAPQLCTSSSGGCR